MNIEEWLEDLEIELPVPLDENSVQPTSDQCLSLRENLQQYVNELLGADGFITIPVDAACYPYDSKCVYTTSDLVEVEIQGGPKKIGITLSDPGDFENGAYVQFTDLLSDEDRDFRLLELQKGYVSVVEIMRTRMLQDQRVKDAPALTCGGLYQFMGNESVLTIQIERLWVSLTVSMFNSNAITFELDWEEVPDVLEAMLNGKPWRKGDYLLNALFTGEQRVEYTLLLTRYSSGNDDEPMRSVSWVQKNPHQSMKSLTELLESLEAYYSAIYAWAASYALEFGVQESRAIDHLLVHEV